MFSKYLKFLTVSAHFKAYRAFPNIGICKNQSYMSYLLLLGNHAYKQEKENQQGLNVSNLICYIFSPIKIIKE